MEQNLEEELYLITFTTMPNMLAMCQSPLCKNRQLQWYYEKVQDILERNGGRKQ